MEVINSANEAIDIGARFRSALKRKILLLETNATSDEIVARTLTEPDQVRRHFKLVQAQRDEADRLRSFLTGSRTTREL